MIKQALGTGGQTSTKQGPAGPVPQLRMAGHPSARDDGEARAAPAPAPAPGHTFRPLPDNNRFCLSLDKLLKCRAANGRFVGALKSDREIDKCAS
ncbi:hypothetical protein EVAR_4744_1 [Eumeta japonica]|uniref:Uncharacterized protein n=1 Tax=Eumeta variegata TaxID=151549 RepID=A0A4C1T1M4_EUMVA|nr:hypothetical protein EVAR_4744_1 [Eumeta japonica]